MDGDDIIQNRDRFIQDHILLQLLEPVLANFSGDLFLLSGFLLHKRIFAGAVQAVGGQNLDGGNFFLEQVDFLLLFQ
jgi:hypothetical protein